MVPHPSTAWLEAEHNHSAAAGWHARLELHGWSCMAHPTGVQPKPLHFSLCPEDETSLRAAAFVGEGAQAAAPPSSPVGWLHPAL